MSGVTISLDIRELQKKLNILASSLQQLKPVLDSIGGGMVSRVTGGFADAQDPYGNKWEPLAPSSERARLRRNKRNFTKKGRLNARGRREAAAGFQPLSDTGRLRNSITFQSDRDSVTFGSGDDLVYAATHQFGDDLRGIPARPFLPTEENGLPDDWQQDVVDAVHHHIAKALR